jgi:hypothetical protein
MLTETSIVAVGGELPEVEDKLNQVASSVAVQAISPKPTFAISKDCDAGSLPPTVASKVRARGVTSRTGDWAELTVIVPASNAG